MTNRSLINFQRMLAVGLLILLTACAPPVKVPIEERVVLTVKQQSEEIGGQLVRIVQSGDTLYSVAFESNLDVNKLAVWNGISDTRQLRVGQRIRLTRPPGFVDDAPLAAESKVKVETNTEPSVVVHQPEVKESVLSIPNNETNKERTQAALNNHTNDRTPSAPQAKMPDRGVSRNAIEPKPTGDKLANRVAGINWSWPVSGKLIRRFSPSSSQQGIDILSSSGQAVVTSAPGEVVYVGNSLKGYGNLIIVKHDENFLSAYAHNQRILVAEGQQISAHHVIGAVGSNNRRETALHFQIRRKGKPVNPLNYLSTQPK